MTPERDLSHQNPLPVQKMGVGTDDLLVVPLKAPRGNWRLVPPVLALLFAVGLIAYRTRVSDWRPQWRLPSLPIAKAPTKPNAIPAPGQAEKPGASPLVARQPVAEKAVPLKAPRGNWRLVPPVLALLFAVGLIAYRTRVSDWRPQWRLPSPPIAKAPTKPNAIPAPSQVEKPGAAPLVARQPGAEKAEPPALAQLAKPEEPAAPPQLSAIDEIQKEAERIKAEREELAKIKEREGEKLAERARDPRVLAGRDAAGFRRQQLQAERRMQLALEAHERRFNELLAAQDKFFARNGINRRLDGDLSPDALFAQMRQDMLELRRKSDEAQRAAREKLNNDRLIPNPPAPGIMGANPNVRRFDFVDRNGNRVSGVEIRSGAFRER